MPTQSRYYLSHMIIGGILLISTLAPALEPVDHVRTRIGKSGGQTFLGATVPFGMVQIGPDTYGWEEYCYAFSMNHLSGAGCGALRSVPIVPVVVLEDSLRFFAQKVIAPRMNLASEKAKAESYEVSLSNGVAALLGATTRTSFSRFVFPATPNAFIRMGISEHGNTKTYGAQIDIIGDHEVNGWVSNGGFCFSGSETTTVYFHAAFDRPFSSWGVWTNTTYQSRGRSANGVKCGGYVGFDTRTNAQVQVKIGLSYVSKENAKLNLEQESPGWDIETVIAQARSAWIKRLSAISVTGGTDNERDVFYTALYHTMIHPNVYSDVNRQYRRFDNRVYTSVNGTEYHTFSGWDVYRNQVQLLSLIAPEVAQGLGRYLVEGAASSRTGKLPVWPIGNGDTYVMGGTPSTSALSSMYAWRVNGFQTDALKHMFKDFDSWYRFGSYGSASGILESCNGDFSLAQFAARIGASDSVYRYHMKRAQNWKTHFNHDSRFILSRDQNTGAWRDPTQGFTEGTKEQYLWMVYHNLGALIDSIGGDAPASARLDTLFTNLNSGNDGHFYNHGNEPNMHIPWVYNWTGKPYKAQNIVWRLRNELYMGGRLPGDDDLGTMSAWLVFAALGLYPLIPGTDGFAINSPLFPQATLRLASGKVVSVNGGSNVSYYIQSLQLNSRPYERTWVPYDSLVNGAVLDFTCASQPSVSWASAPSARPPSFDEGAPAPPITAISRFPGVLVRTYAPVPVIGVIIGTRYPGMKSSDGKTGRFMDLRGRSVAVRVIGNRVAQGVVVDRRGEKGRR